MPFFTKTPPRGIAIPNLILAAHEVGHALAFCHAGIGVERCEIDLVGEGDGGTVIEDPNLNQHHGYLVGLTAGKAGELLWCETYGQHAPKHVRNGWSASGDRTLYDKHQRQHRDTRGFAWRAAEKQAREILRDNAKQFRRLTEELARHGVLKLGW